MFDPDYIVQGCYSDSSVCDSTGSDDEIAAIALARAMLRSLYFEGDYVTVMTRFGELVWDSRSAE